MAGLVPAIHAEGRGGILEGSWMRLGVDARDKPGHDSSELNARRDTQGGEGSAHMPAFQMKAVEIHGTPATSSSPANSAKR